MISRDSCERGQVLIVLVFVLVGLLAAAGLAVDGGTAILERRRMQNAADAAALAGTRQLAAHLCDESPDEAAIDAAIWDEIIQYAERNGVRDPSNNVVADYLAYDVDSNDVTVTGPVGSGDVPAGSLGISATVMIERPTALLTLVGQDTAAASAHATAVTGPARTPPAWDSGQFPSSFGGGILPVGLLYANLFEAGEPVEAGERMCIIDNADWADECTDKDTDAEIVQCLVTQNLPSANRGWLTLSCIFNDGQVPGGGVGSRLVDCSASASMDKAWINQTDPFTDPIYAGPVPPPYSKHGDWVVGKPGVVASVFSAFENLGEPPWQGTTFFVPVFDRIWLGTRMQSEPTFVETDNEFTTNDYWYHIVGFVGVHINTPAEQQQTPGCSSGDISVEFDQIIHHDVPPEFIDEWGWEEEGTCESLNLAITLHN